MSSPRSADPTTLIIPINYGTISIYLGKRGDRHQHRWIAFVRSPDHLDLSFLIDNVTFILHETFENSVRGELTSLRQLPLHHGGDGLGPVRDDHKDQPEGAERPRGDSVDADDVDTGGWRDGGDGAVVAQPCRWHPH